MPAKKTKECPYCWEEILEKAIKCRFCWEFLEEQSQKNKIKEKKAEKENDKKEIYDEYEEFWTSDWYLAFLWIAAIITFPIYIWIIFVCVAIIYHCQKIEIHKDHLVYKHWVFVKRKEEIPFKKINSVDTKSFIFDDLVIRTWNDKPTIFKNVEECRKIVDIIKERIN